MRRDVYVPPFFRPESRMYGGTLAVKPFSGLLTPAVLLAAGLFFSPLAASADDGELVNPYAGREDIVEEGGSLLNQYCSHCHGPWAVQGERPRDLRRLNLRYGDYAMSTFYTTVQNGRPPKGMPPWKGILEDDIIWKIYTFLQSVQVED
jgi:mono/diheme cytochrome c family protein